MNMNNPNYEHYLGQASQNDSSKNLSNKFRRLTIETNHYYHHQDGQSYGNNVQNNFALTDNSYISNQVSAPPPSPVYESNSNNISESLNASSIDYCPQFEPITPEPQETEEEKGSLFMNRLRPKSSLAYYLDQASKNQSSLSSPVPSTVSSTVSISNGVKNVMSNLPQNSFPLHYQLGVNYFNNENNSSAQTSGYHSNEDSNRLTPYSSQSTKSLTPLSTLARSPRKGIQSIEGGTRTKQTVVEPKPKMSVPIKLKLKKWWASISQDQNRKKTPSPTGTTQNELEAMADSVSAALQAHPISASTVSATTSNHETKATIDRSKPIQFRLRLTNAQLARLEEEFQKTPFLCLKKRLKLSMELNITSEQLMSWFSRRRCRKTSTQKISFNKRICSNHNNINNHINNFNHVADQNNNNLVDNINHNNNIDNHNYNINLFNSPKTCSTSKRGPPPPVPARVSSLQSRAMTRQSHSLALVPNLITFPTSYTTQFNNYDQNRVNFQNHFFTNQHQ